MGFQNLDWTSALGCVLGTLGWVPEDVSGAAVGIGGSPEDPPLPFSSLLDQVDMLLAGHRCFSKSLPLGMGWEGGNV